MRFRRMLISVLTAITLIVGTAGITALPAAAASGPYGALVYSRSTNNIWISFGNNNLQTQYSGLNACLQNAKDCNAVIWVHSGWMGIAISSNRAWGAGWSSTENGAINQAKAAARRHGATNKFTYTKSWYAQPRGIFHRTSGGLGVGIVSPPLLQVELKQVLGFADGARCLGDIAKLPLPITFLSPSCVSILATLGVNVPMLLSCLNVPHCREQVVRHPFFP